MMPFRLLRAVKRTFVLLMFVGAIVALPKLITGHCLLHELGVVDWLGYDPLHVLCEKARGLITGR